MPRSFYDVLGVARDAPADAIRSAYRDLAARYHPDRNPGFPEQARAKFQEATAAYEVLNDADKRAAYDRDPEPFEQAAPSPPPDPSLPPDVGQALDDATEVAVGLVDLFAPPTRAEGGRRAVTGAARLLRRILTTTPRR